MVYTPNFCVRWHNWKVGRSAEFEWIHPFHDNGFVMKGYYIKISLRQTAKIKVVYTYRVLCKAFHHHLYYDYPPLQYQTWFIEQGMGLSVFVCWLPSVQLLLSFFLLTSVFFWGRFVVVLLYFAPSVSKTGLRLVVCYCPVAICGHSISVSSQEGVARAWRGAST